MCKYLCWNSSCGFSHTEKGFSLIEVMCSICLFSFMSIFILTVNVSAFKIKKYSDKLNNYNYFMEEVRNNFLYNYSSDDIKRLKGQGKFYISKDNIKVSTLKYNNLENLLLKSEPLEKPYLEIYIEELDTQVVNVEDDLKVNDIKKENNVKLMKINLELNTDLKKKSDLIKYEVYKGTYK